MTETCAKMYKEYSRVSRRKNIWDAEQQLAQDQRAKDARAKRYYKELCAIHSKRKEGCSDDEPERRADT